LQGVNDPVVGDENRIGRTELKATCIALLTLQVQEAAREGVAIWENGVHLCTLYPHAWGHMVDRAEAAGDTATSYAHGVDLACGHCLVRREQYALDDSVN